MLNIAIRQVDLHGIGHHLKVVNAKAELQPNALLTRLLNQDVVKYRTQNTARSGHLSVHQGRAGDKSQRTAHDIANLNTFVCVSSTHDLLEHAQLL